MKSEQKVPKPTNKMIDLCLGIALKVHGGQLCLVGFRFFAVGLSLLLRFFAVDILLIFIMGVLDAERESRVHCVATTPEPVALDGVGKSYS